MSRSLFLTPDGAQRYVDAFLNTRGVAGLWPLWENGAMGTAYRDLSRNANHGVEQNAAMVKTSIHGSVATRALLGNGTSSWIKVNDNAALDLGDVFTCSAIIQRGALGASRAIVSKVRNSYYLRIAADGTLNLLRSNVSDTVHSTIVVDGTRPHHVAGTKNGATVKLYVDGVDVTGTVSNSTYTNSGQELRIMADEGSGTSLADWSNGRVAMVGLHNRALAANEIAMLSVIALS